RSPASSQGPLLEPRLHGKAGPPPLGKPFEQAPSAASLGSQDVHRMIRVDAVRPAAVGDVLVVFRKLPEAALELVDGDGDRAGNVAGDVLACGSGIENDH